MRSSSLVVVLLSLLLPGLQAHGLAVTPRPPNILLIVLDDAGYSDLGAFGRGDAPTPALDQLAAEGVRYTRFYADATCRPARLSLMTGQPAAEVAVTPDFRGISPEVVTLAEALREQGYATHHVGKWHLGEIPEALPPAQGFDSWFGFASQFQLRGPDDAGKLVNRRPTYIDPWLQGSEQPPQRYRGNLNDILAGRAASKLQQIAAHNQPWFLNYWLFAPHNPVTPVAPYSGTEPDTPAGKYRATLKHMDASVARVLEALQDSGQADNTIVVVLSDNGGTNEYMDNNYPFAGSKDTYLEGGMRTPLVIRWPGGLPAGTVNPEIMAIADVYPSLLTLAGLEIPAGMRTLADRRGQALVNESSTIGKYSYTVLSGDGRWRLVNNALYDLDVSSAVDVAIKHPDIVQHMKTIYFGWYRQKMVLPLTVSGPVPGLNLGMMTGDSLRRTPGHGGWTFAAGIEFPATANASQVIAAQEGVWSLEFQADRRLRLGIGAAGITSSRLPSYAPGSCHAVVISTMNARSSLHDFTATQMALYVDGELRGSFSEDHIPDIMEHYQNPTVLGAGVGGKGIFQGKIHAPLMLNTHLYSREFIRQNLEPGYPDVEEISAQVCPGQQAPVQ